MPRRVKYNSSWVPVDPKKWTQIRNIPLHVVSKILTRLSVQWYCVCLTKFLIFDILVRPVMFFFLQEKPLDETLTFDNGHICKRAPTEIVKFYLQSAESSELFRGVVNVDLIIAKPTPNDPNSNTEHTSSHPIMVEMSGNMIGTSQIQDKRDDDNTVSIVIGNIKFCVLFKFWQGICI